MRNKTLLLVLSLGVLMTANLYPQTAVKIYKDRKHGFSVSYPIDFGVLVGSKAKSETAFGDPGAGVKLASVTPKNIPDKYHGSYEFSIWRSSDPKDKCVAPVEGENVGDMPVGEPDESSPKTRTIGGQTFYAYSGEEAGMSKSLVLAGYRGVVGGKCWQMQSMSYQVSAYENFKYFDRKIIEKAFEKFVSSFKFTGK